MRKCKDCGADLAGRHHHTRFCHNCAADRERTRQRKEKSDWYWNRGGKKKKAAAARDPEYKARAASRRRAQRHAQAPLRKCAGCGRPTGRGIRTTLCLDCKNERLERRRNDVFRHKTYARVRCPDGKSFDEWLEHVILHPIPPLPDLMNEPETWRPFVVPDYLK